LSLPLLEIYVDDHKWILSESQRREGGVGTYEVKTGGRSDVSKRGDTSPGGSGGINVSREIHVSRVRVSDAPPKSTYVDNPLKIVLVMKFHESVSFCKEKVSLKMRQQ
jgi:hypothetical protein